MRIGILTLPLHFNYGGILQAYALQTVLTRLGHDVSLIEKSRKRPMPSLLIVVERILLKYLRRKDIAIFKEIKTNKERPVVCQHTWAFVDKYIKIDMYPKGLKSIPKNCYDTLIVGSDQIWRKDYFQYFLDADIANAFLDFAKKWDCKRISYAASFGTDVWEFSPKETLQIGNLAKTFNALGVREKSGKEMCRKQLGVDATCVLDPTMLLDKEDYVKLVENSNVGKSPGTLLYSVLDTSEARKEIIDVIASQTNLVPFNVNSKVEKKHAELKDCIQPPVESWLRGFMDAEMVVTDSFHACVFSIIFNKPFVVIENTYRGNARFDTLLDTFGLSERKVSKKDKALEILSQDINWDKVNSILNVRRKESLQFLMNSL